MTALPRLTQLLAELARRDDRYASVRGRADSVQARGVHGGALSRHLVQGPKAVRLEGLGEWPLATLRAEAEASVKGLLIESVHRQDNDLHAALSQLLQGLDDVKE